MSRDDYSVNPWRPITNQIDLKHLGKLGEESGELNSAVSRCIIQGMDEKEPNTGKVNRDWLEDEIADVIANAILVVEHFKLDTEKLAARAEKKMAALRSWHKMADGGGI